MKLTYLKIYNWVLACGQLSFYQKFVYSLIYQMTATKRKEGWWAGYDVMAKKLNISRRSCITAVAGLIKMNAIRKEEAPCFTNTKYTFKANADFARYHIAQYNQGIKTQK